MVEMQLIVLKIYGWTLWFFVLILRVYLPIQNLLKMFASKSSEDTSPVISPSVFSA